MVRSKRSCVALCLMLALVQSPAFAKTWTTLTDAAGNFAGLYECSGRVGRMSIRIEGTGAAEIEMGELGAPLAGQDLKVKSDRAAKLAGKFTARGVLKKGRISFFATTWSVRSADLPDAIEIALDYPTGDPALTISGKMSPLGCSIAVDRGWTDLATLQAWLLEKTGTALASTEPDLPLHPPPSDRTISVSLGADFAASRWHSVAPCGDDPSELSFRSEASGVTGVVRGPMVGAIRSVPEETWSAVSAGGSDILFSRSWQGNKMLVGHPTADSLIARSTGSGDCVTLYHPAGWPAAAAISPEIFAPVLNAGKSVGIAGVSLGEAMDKARLDLFGLGEAIRLGGGSAGFKAAGLFPGGFVFQSDMDAAVSMRISWAGRNAILTVMADNVSKRIYGIQIEGDLLDFHGLTERLLGPGASRGDKVDQAMGWARYWVSDADAAKVLPPGGDAVCAEYGVAPSFSIIRTTLTPTNCGKLVVTSPGRLRILDTTLFNGAVAARTPAEISAAAQAGSYRPDLPLPGPDIAAEIDQEHLFKLTYESRLYLAGFAAQVFNDCDVVMDWSDKVELATFVQSMQGVVGLGRDYSSPTLGGTATSQVQSMLAARDGSEEAKGRACTDGGNRRAMKFILEVVRANTQSATAGNSRFMQSCSPELSPGQCSCIAGLLTAVDPELASRQYSSDYLAGVLGQNPGLSLKAWAQCGLGNY